MNDLLVPDKVMIVENAFEACRNWHELVTDLSWIQYWDDDTQYCPSGDDEKEALDHAKKYVQVTNSVARLAREQPLIFTDGRAERLYIGSGNEGITFAQAAKAVRQYGAILLWLDFSLADSDDTRDSAFRKKAHRDIATEAAKESLPTGFEKTLGGRVLCHLFAPGHAVKLRMCLKASSYDLTDEVVVTGQAERYFSDAGFCKERRSAMISIIRGLNAWFRMTDVCPLDRLWHIADAESWFLNAKPLSGKPVPHKYDDVGIEAVQYMVKKVLPAKSVPEALWANDDVAMRVFEAFKHMCGTHYCGTSGKPEGAYNLDVGSVYLIALMAMSDVRPQPSDGLHLLYSIAAQLAHPSLSFLWAQQPHDARDTAKAVYYLFRNIFCVETKHPRACVDKAGCDPRGNLQIDLKPWKARMVGEKLRTSAACTEPARWQDAATGCAAELARLMRTNRNGIGHCGAFSFYNGVQSDIGTVLVTGWSDASGTA